MPRRVQLKPWRGDRWKSYVYHGIERRVRNSLDSIAAPLNLDGSAEQEALVEAVTIELRRAWAYLRDVQSAASDPAALHILKELLRAEDLVTKVEQADPNVRRLIEEYDWFSRGKAFVEEIATDPSRLRKATSRALRAVTKSKTSNRPRGTAQFAEHVLAESLSGVFERFGGRATRRHEGESGPVQGCSKVSSAVVESGNAAIRSITWSACRLSMVIVAPKTSVFPQVTARAYSPFYPSLHPLQTPLQVATRRSFTLDSCCSV